MRMNAEFRQGDAVLAQAVEGPSAGNADYVAPVVDGGTVKHLVRFPQGVGLAEDVCADGRAFRPGQLVAVRGGGDESWLLKVWKGRPSLADRSRGWTALAADPGGDEAPALWKQCVPAQEVWEDINLGRPAESGAETEEERFEPGEPVAARSGGDRPWRIAFYLRSLGSGRHSVEPLPGLGPAETAAECRRLDEIRPGMIVMYSEEEQAPDG